MAKDNKNDTAEKPKEAPTTVDGASDGAEGGPPAESKKDKGPRYPYAVATGRSITSLVGILDAGDEVKAEHLSGGKETLEHLVKRGVVVKGR